MYSPGGGAGNARKRPRLELDVDEMVCLLSFLPPAPIDVRAHIRNKIWRKLPPLS